MSRTLTLCLKFPIVTTTLWGQLAGKAMTVHPHSLLLYCTAMFVYVYQTTTFPPHCGDNENEKHSTFTRLWISPSCSGAGLKQWLQMTGAFYIAHARIQKVSPEGVQLGNGFFFDGRIQIPLYQWAIIGPPVKRHLNGDSLACR